MFENNKELADFILERAKENKVVFRTFDGLCEINIDDFLAQPTEGLLYDLNRDAVTVMSWIDSDENTKWVNDYAVMLVITRLKERVETLEKVNAELRQHPLICSNETEPDK